VTGIGGGELLIVLFIAIVIFGAGKLPELSGAMGKSIKEFKQATTDDVPSPAPEAAAVSVDRPQIGTRADDI
jgi:sec-independent protein translocase protein TatA